MSEQLFCILQLLIRKHQIHIPSAELKLQLQSHPSYPSLHALTGVLTHFGIENIALRVPTDQATLSQLPDCFIANVSYQENMELVLVEKQKDQFKISYDEDKTLLVRPEDFLATWNGIVVAIEKNEKIVEDKTDRWLSLGRQISGALALLLLLVVAFQQADLFAGIHFGLSLLGLGISIFIVQHELGLNASMTQRFCNLSETTSCEAVLQSEGSSLFGFLKMSDLSVLSFTNFILIWLLFFVGGWQHYLFLYLASIAAFPMVLYTLYYQARVIKKWCPLCLGVASVLVLQFILVLFTDRTSWWMKPNATVSVLVAFSICSSSLAWLLLKPWLVKNSALENIQLNYYKFKRNFEVFKTLHYQEEALVSTQAIKGELVFGNENAAIELILVTNPLCFYCKRAHQEIERVLQQSKGQIKLSIRFNVKRVETTQLDYEVIVQLHHIYHTQGASAALKALTEVYADDVELKAWLAQQDLADDAPYAEMIAQQGAWCQNHQINFTPAFYLNGSPFPREYEREDLLYFIEDLTEEAKLNELSMSA